jgi:hypothetical protein
MRWRPAATSSSKSLSYANGSIGTVCYFANGDRSLPKERVEVFAHGCAAVLWRITSG